MMRFSRRSKRFLSRGEEKDLKKSIQNYEQLVQQEPKNPEYWNSLGDLYLRAREREKALQCYEKAFHLYAEDGYTENAIGVGKKILRHDPARAEIHLELAKLYADPDVKNYKASLDEIQRFYQTAQRLTHAELNVVMELLSRIWGDLSSQENVEDLPIAENLFAQTEELIASIAMSGMTETENPLRQEDLAALEEVYGGEVESERPVGPEIVSHEPEETGLEPEPGVILTDTPEPLEPTLEEESFESSPEPEEVAPRIEIEEAGVEEPTLPEEPTPPLSPEASDGETDALFSVLEESIETSPFTEEKEVVEVVEESAPKGTPSSEPREVPPPDSPRIAAPEELSTEIPTEEPPLDPALFTGFLAEQIPLLGGEKPETDYLAAGYDLLAIGRAEEALQAFATALREGAPPFQALLGIARACAVRGDHEGVLEAVQFMERLEPRQGEDWKALSEAYALRARTLRDAGKTAEALRDARRARILGGQP